MLPEEERPIAETKASNGPSMETSAEPSTELAVSELVTPMNRGELVTPMNREELATKFEQLATRARAAGISPLQAMAKTYVTRGMAVLEALLSALEEAPKKTPADTEKKV